MLSHPLNKVIFLDIETTSQYPTFEAMPEKLQQLFLKRFKTDVDKMVEFNDEAIEELYNTKAPLMPEFGRILCISLGYFSKLGVDGSDYELKVDSFSSENEKDLLDTFIQRTKTATGGFLSGWNFCAHNGKAFDYPYIAKRMVYNRLTLPPALDFAEKKPWEVPHLMDTREIWKMGGWDSTANVSLDLLCYSFGIPSSKDDIDGSEVKNIFWINKDLPRIVTYCEKDVLALAKCYLRMKGKYEEITIVKE